jgi:hypothetical protein
MFGLNWGNGFVTDRELIDGRRLSDANPFFQELVRKPYVDKVSLLYVGWNGGWFFAVGLVEARRLWAGQQQSAS